MAMSGSNPSVTLLNVPGYTNSGPRHWQTLWEGYYRSIHRVHQRDWDRPERTEWVEALDAAARDARGPVVLVAHSLGCATVAHWLSSGRTTDMAVGVLMVAPADVDTPNWPPGVVGFAPMPMKTLPLQSTVIASGDDPWVDLERARAFADAWGSEMVHVGELGHLNAESGLGSWPEGRRQLEALVKRCGFAPLA
jgi:uncharacterized protein